MIFFAIDLTRHDNDDREEQGINQISQTLTGEGRSMFGRAEKRGQIAVRTRGRLPMGPIPRVPGPPRQGRAAV